MGFPPGHPCQVPNQPGAICHPFSGRFEENRLKRRRFRKVSRFRIMTIDFVFYQHFMTQTFLLKIVALAELHMNEFSFSKIV